MIPEDSINVLGTALQPCSQDPLTGFFRDGCCNTCEADTGSHTVCAIMTDEFLAFSKYVGNDLSTPRPEYHFPGLKAGDQWCVCAARFAQAVDAGCGPLVHLEATHQKALEIMPLSILEAHKVVE
ncbi:MAG: DUF2237 domain-containing protein [Aestuariivita sp.]|nr:DUF2237 domain-containing protein [Aestuariivita sp.]MCY4201495.1 DUF2237 domain-containing protein [Aestuariivita sp.]MCY4287738.1 DUF2237 domain-containing protein [Aestuariivita sp.]MCY4347028.1 DUF2237 domain-containing protein [Aestuariivita sp.]